jgi:hypothetical protein
MKIYKFFKIPSENEKDNVDIERKYVLYAITNNKEMYERFKTDRNMKKFIIKIHDDITKEEYVDICNDPEVRSSVLEYHELLTIFDDKHTKKNSTNASVLMTNWEYQIVKDMDITNEGMWMYMPYPLIFKKKYVKALDILEYINQYKIFTVERLPLNLLDKINKFVGDDDYSAPNIIYDEVAIFIDIIRDTL